MPPARRSGGSFAGRPAGGCPAPGAPRGGRGGVETRTPAPRWADGDGGEVWRRRGGGEPALPGCQVGCVCELRLERRPRLRGLALRGLRARLLLERALALAARRRLGAVFERPVDDVEDVLVLPGAEREGGGEGEDRDDEPRAQLVEVLDEAEPVLVADRAQPRRHRGGGR